MFRSSMLVLALTAVVPVARANVIWRGDFSTGDLSQWPKRETVDAATRLQVVPGPVEGEGPALQVSVRQGDNPIHASGNRNELVYAGDRIEEGSERYYHWRTLWPADYAAQDVWQIFTQWHHFTGGGSPPMAFLVWGEEVRLGIQTGEVLWSTPLERGRWHDFVFHVGWSSDPGRGYVELWYDGRIAMPRSPRATMFPGQGVYLKQGLYRSSRVQADQVLFHRGMTVGTTLDDVWPRPPAAQGPAAAGGVTTAGLLQETTGATGGPGAAGCAQVPAAGAGLVAVLARWRRRRRPVT